MSESTPGVRRQRSESVKRLLAVSWLLGCGLSLAAPPLPKVAPPVPDKTAITKAQPPNPNGRKGGDAHQAKVEEVAKDVKARGLRAEKEQVINTPEGSKSKRFVDVAGINESTEEIEEMHQVGVQTKKGQPVAREKEALDDIEKATGKRPQFHPYNKKD